MFSLTDIRDIVEGVFDENWLKYRTEKSERNKRRILRSMAREISYGVLDRAGYDFSFKRTPLEEIAKSLNIRQIQSRYVLGEATLQKTGNSWTVTHLFGLSNQRQRFSLAHEIAHIFLKLAEKNYASIRNDEKIEEFCDRIAAELIVPEKLFEVNEFNEIVGKLAGYLNYSDFEDLHLNGPKLSINIIEGMRKHLYASRDTLIRQLHWTKFLDECNSGILCCTKSFNRKTGRLLDLRVLYAASPSWMFIPNNKRVKSVINVNVSHFLENLKDNEKYSQKIQISTKIKKEDNRWSKEVNLECIAEFTTYSYITNKRRERRLLITFSINPKSLPNKYFAISASP